MQILLITHFFTHLLEMEALVTTLLYGHRVIHFS